MNQEHAKKLVDEALNTLTTALEQGHSDALRRYLAVMGRFYRYSWGNSLLIASQRPNATRVAGFHAWKKLGRHVRKGEKGIVILAPVVVKKHVDSDDGDSLTANARTLALLNMAISDSSVTVFAVKYFYQTWRPVTAIRAGDTDGNSRTELDPGFTPFIITPAFPGYPSAHASGSNAARYVLEGIFGRGRHLITLSNAALPGVTLNYTKLQQITDDIDDGRVYGGIHFRFDQEEGGVLERRVGRYVMNHNLRCARPDGCDEDEPDADEVAEYDSPTGVNR